ncbi:MAG TPA: zf-HC2 domain-containing protein [Pyrinomonadaceae bacterium]|nr:zf-HC2 domain-containing protein [Pyrinomonadaceae bacterium]
MNETTKIDYCERAGELVAYFYGEANRDERASFDAHLASCGACRDELAAFAEVREAVGHWRAEILDHAPARSFAGTAAGIGIAPEALRDGVRVAVLPRRSALAALREFFTLSPAWLRAGMAAAALAVCALLALAAFNAEVRWDGDGLAFSTRFGRNETRNAPRAEVSSTAGKAGVSATAAKVDTQAELDKLVAERDAALRELEDTRAQLDDSREANLIAAVETLEPVSVSETHSSRAYQRRARRASNAPAARPKQRRTGRDEEDVPRLYDLLIEAN